MLRDLEERGQDPHDEAEEEAVLGRAAHRPRDLEVRIRGRHDPRLLLLVELRRQLGRRRWWERDLGHGDEIVRVDVADAVFRLLRRYRLLERADAGEIRDRNRPALLPERAGIRLLPKPVDDRAERRVLVVEDAVLIDTRIPCGDRGTGRFDALEKLLVLGAIVMAAGEHDRAALRWHPSDERPTRTPKRRRLVRDERNCGVGGHGHQPSFFLFIAGVRSVIRATKRGARRLSGRE
jgi:hypothetical protein